MKRTISLLLVSASMLLLGVLIYALVFAAPDSTYRKNGFVIGIFFITVTGLARIALRRSKEIRI